MKEKTKKKRGRDFTVIERTYIFEAAKRGVPLQQVNETLARDMEKLGADPRPVPESTYAMIRRSYLPRFDKLWDHIHSPRRLGDYKAP